MNILKTMINSCITLVLICIICLMTNCSRQARSNRITGTKDRVIRVIDGSTIELQRGLKVKLIGIKSSDLAEDWLNREVKEKNVILTADSKDRKQSYRSSLETVHAYVKIQGDNRGSVNGMLLRMHKADLDYNYCNDSLTAFTHVEQRPELTDTELYSHLRPASFLILGAKGDQRWSGTGFYISSDGLALTNNHVLPPSADVIRIYYYDSDGQVDRSNYRSISRILDSWNIGVFDVTLFKVQLEEGERVAYLPMAREQEHQGAKLSKLGNPGNETCNYQTGNLSRYNNDSGSLVHSCPSNPGDSGGPVVNARGEVVGINQSVHMSSQGENATQLQGIANAVDITLLIDYLDKKGIEYGQ